MPIQRAICTALLAFATPLAAQDLRFDSTHLDASVSACTDFYRHANGGWLDRNPVPPGAGSHGLFDEMRQRHLQQRLVLVRELAADTARTGEPIADFIASGLDEQAIESAGRMDLDVLLAPIAAIDKPARQVSDLIATLHARGLPLLFRADVLQHGDGPQLRLLAAGLGLPDRDYYLREDAAARTLLGQYRGYVERMLALAGSADPANDAAWVLDAEMRLARGWPAMHDRAPDAESQALRALQRSYPAIDWRGWLKANGLARQSTLALAEPAFFAELNGLIANAPAVQWRAYLRFHIAHLMAPFLGAEFVRAHDGFFQQVLRGRTTPLTRAERVLDAAERVLGPAFEQAVNDRLLPASSRAAAEQLVADLRATLREGLGSAPWLHDAEARQAAVARLDMMAVELALPGAPTDLGNIRFDRGRYAENVLRAAVRLQRQREARLQQRGTVRDAVTTPAMAAQYDPRSNKLQVGVGVLQLPLFDATGDQAWNFGSLGAVLAHEMLHGFDLAGAAWAGETPSAQRIAAFEHHTAPLRAQYQAYRDGGDRPIDGARTLAENAADVAGIEIAWRTLQNKHPELAANGSGHAPGQRFFLGWAQMWRRNYTDADLLRRLQRDPYPPSAFRVNGPVLHQAAFATAFGCNAGQPMFLPPEQRLTMFR
jgi:putative endopeptidase